MKDCIMDCNIAIRISPLEASEQKSLVGKLFWAEECSNIMFSVCWYSHDSYFFFYKHSVREGM